MSMLHSLCISIHYDLCYQTKGLKNRLGKPVRGEWMESIKILLEGDEDSNKTNTASESRLRLNYPSWPRTRSH
jgi:hypothetical protein